MASSSAGYQTNEQSVSPPSPTTNLQVSIAEHLGVLAGASEDVVAPAVAVAERDLRLAGQTGCVRSGWTPFPL